MALAKPPLDILLCAPRGFCAGVDRAIQIVELALEKYRRAGLCPPRDRPQPLRRRQPQGEGRRLRRGARRDPGDRPAGDLLRAWRRQGGAGGGAERATSSSSTPPARSSPRCTARPRSTFAAGREIVLVGHAGHPEVVGTMGQLAAGRGHADRDRGGRPRASSRDRAASSPSSRRPRSRSTTPRRSSASSRSASRRSSGRTRRTSATRPPTARRRSSGSPRDVDAMIVVGAPNSSNSQRLREVAERAGCPVAVLVQRAAEIDWTLVRRRSTARRHGRRLGAGGAGRGSHRRLRRALRRATVEVVTTAEESVAFNLPRELRADARRVHSPAFSR